MNKRSHNRVHVTEQCRALNMNISCWICGDPADSREHKFLRSIIAQLYGSGRGLKDNSGLGFVSRGKARLLQSPKSSYLKFAPSLCRYCNSTRTQSADECFRAFWLSVASHFDQALINGRIDIEGWCAVSHTVVLSLQLNAKRYLAKLFGCALSEENWTVPVDLVSFVKGNPNNHKLRFFLAVNEDVLLFPEPWRFFGKANIVRFVDSSGALEDSYYWAIQTGPLRIYVEYGLQEDICGCARWGDNNSTISLTKQSFISANERKAFEAGRTAADRLISPRWVTTILTRLPGAPKDDDDLLIFADQEA